MSKRMLLLPLVALVACQKATVDGAYVEREKFTFYSEGLEKPASYLCESGKNYTETKARAEAAHAVFLKTYMQSAPGSMDAGIDESDAAQIEENYQCVVVKEP